MAHALKRLFVGVLAGLIALVPILVSPALAQSTAGPPKPAYVDNPTVGQIGIYTGAQKIGSVPLDSSTLGIVDNKLTVLGSPGGGGGDGGGITTTGSSILMGNGSGGVANVTIGTGLTFGSGTLSAGANAILTNPSNLGDSILQQTGTLPSSSLPVGSLSLYTGGTPRAYFSLGAPFASPAFVQSQLSGIDTYAVTMGTGPTNGNFLIAAAWSNTGIPAPNGGWNVFATHFACGSDPNMVLLWRKVAPGEAMAQTPALGATSGNWGTEIVEVSGLGNTWGPSLENTVFGCMSMPGNPPGTMTLTTTASTSMVNNLAISFLGATAGSNFPATSVLTPSWNTGWTNVSQTYNAAAPGGMMSWGVATQSVPSVGATINSETTIADTLANFRNLGQVVGLVILGPGSNQGAQPFSFLSTIKNQNTVIDTNPVSLNCVSGISCVSDSAGGITLTATGSGGTVTTSGTPSTGQMTKFSGGTVITTAVAGTDYISPTSGSAIQKANGSGGLTAATAGTDYAAPTSGTSILKGNGSGGFTTAVSGTDYATPTSGSSILAGNGSGGFAGITVGTGLNLTGTTLSNVAVGPTTTHGTFTNVSTLTIDGFVPGFEYEIVFNPMTWNSGGTTSQSIDMAYLNTDGTAKTAAYFAAITINSGSIIHPVGATAPIRIPFGGTVTLPNVGFQLWLNFRGGSAAAGGAMAEYWQQYGTEVGSIVAGDGTQLGGVKFTTTAGTISGGWTLRKTPL